MTVFNGAVDRSLAKQNAGANLAASNSSNSGLSTLKIAPKHPATGTFGVNLSVWLVQEIKHNPYLFQQGSDPTAVDECILCQSIGMQACTHYFNKQYASYHTTKDVDLAAGVNTLRIPTTYQAWIQMPGFYLVYGRQVKYLTKIADYATNKYGMTVIVGLHGLPGGINGMDIGEALGMNN